MRPGRQKHQLVKIRTEEQQKGMEGKNGRDDKMTGNGDPETNGEGVEVDWHGGTYLLPQESGSLGQEAHLFQPGLGDPII